MFGPVTNIADIGIDRIYQYTQPLFKALYPYSVMLFALVFIWWLVGKVIAWQNGQEKPLAILGKALAMLFIIFMWPHIFIGSYLLNDAWAARIIEIDITQNLPDYIQSTIREEELPTNFDNVIRQMRSQVFWEKQKAKYERDNDPRFFQKWANYLLADAAATLKDFGQLKSTTQETFGFVIEFIAGIAKNIVLLIRLILACFYYIAIPFLFVLSFLPIIGESNEGINSYSKKTISWFLNMILWPTIFALLDKVFLVVYYVLIHYGLLYEFNIMIAFYCAYVILLISLPISIARANPYGIVHGTISALQTVAMVGAMGVGGLAKGGVGGVAGATAIGRMSNIAKNTAKSNVDIAADKGDS